MKISVLKDENSNEQRVAATPESVNFLKYQSFSAIITADIIKKTLTTPSPFSTENLLAFQPPIIVPIPRHIPYGKSTKPLKKKVRKAPIVYTRTITTLVAFTRIKFNLL